MVHGGYSLPSSLGYSRHLFISQSSNISSCHWAQGLIVKLLETTHGQFLYRCVQVHDKVAGTLIIACKEEIQRKIERQLELGMEELLDLAEIITNDLGSGSGERQEYSLLAICAARKAGLLWRQQQLNPRGWTPVESRHVH
jgi:hypothetical protein